MNYDLKVIKKKFGENMMKLSRELFPTLLEEKGLLSGIFLDNFNPSKTLYDDIKKENLEKEFKMFIYGFLNKDEVIENSKKTPKELFEEEFNELTRICNAHCIRHHEKGKIPIENELQYKYFYLRCYALISVVMDLLK